MIGIKVFSDDTISVPVTESPLPGSYHDNSISPDSPPSSSNDDLSCPVKSDASSPRLSSSPSSSVLRAASSPPSFPAVVGRTHGGVPAALKALKLGKMCVVVDDKNRENEGDLVMAAQFATPSKIAFMVQHTSGVLCAAMSGDDLDRLKLPLMTPYNEDPNKTAFSLSVDAVDGTSGISATSRARTFRLLAAAETIPTDLQRPGHVFPLRARPGGLDERRGHTEAAIELCDSACLNRVGIVGEIVSRKDITDMARLEELQEFAEEHDMSLISTQEILDYRRSCVGAKSLSPHVSREGFFRGCEHPARDAVRT